MANALLILQEARRADKIELDALVEEAEKAETPEATIAALETSQERRAALVTSIASRDAQIDLETRRRAQVASAPAIPDPLLPGAAAPAAGARVFSVAEVAAMRPAEYERNRDAIHAQARASRAS